jgi:hypothetical protein
VGGPRLLVELLASLRAADGRVAKV